jgi:hypothetical protein
MPWVLVTVPLSLTGCAAENSRFSACPIPVIYGAAVLAEAARELVLLPDQSAIAGRFLPDYSRLRDQSWACLGGRP